MKEGVGCRPLRAVNVVVVVVTGQVFRASLTLDNAEGCAVDATPQCNLDVLYCAFIDAFTISSSFGLNAACWSSH